MKHELKLVIKEELVEGVEYLHISEHHDMTVVYLHNNNLVYEDSVGEYYSFSTTGYWENSTFYEVIKL